MPHNTYTNTHGAKDFSRGGPVVPTADLGQGFDVPPTTTTTTTTVIIITTLLILLTLLLLLMNNPSSRKTVAAVSGSQGMMCSVPRCCSL